MHACTRCTRRVKRGCDAKSRASRLHRLAALRLGRLPVRALVFNMSALSKHKDALNTSAHSCRRGPDPALPALWHAARCSGSPFPYCTIDSCCGWLAQCCTISRARCLGVRKLLVQQGQGAQAFLLVVIVQGKQETDEKKSMGSLPLLQTTSSRAPRHLAWLMVQHCASHTSRRSNDTRREAWAPCPPCFGPGSFNCPKA